MSTPQRPHSIVISTTDDGVTSPAGLNTDSFSDRSAFLQNNMEKKDLFFNFGKQDDEIEQLIELQRGKSFEAIYIVSETSGKFRNVALTINLKGIKVTEPRNKKRSRQFMMEQILQYSYNRSAQKFTFAYLESDGVLTNYRFTSKDFFDVHQTLGIAIALMVKVRNGEVDVSQIPDFDLLAEDNDSDSPLNGNDTNDDTAPRHMPPRDEPVEDKKSGEEINKDQPAIPSFTIQTQPAQFEMASSIMPKSFLADNNMQLDSPDSFDSPSDSNFGDGPSVVVHAGGDDDAASIMTTATSEYQDDVKKDKPNDITPIPRSKSTSGKKDSSAKTLTKGVRGWNLFSTTRFSGKAPGKSSYELPNIQENGNSATSNGSVDGLNAPKGAGDTLNTKKFGSLSALERRKSVQEIFGGPKSPEEKYKGSLSQFPTVSAEGATSAASIDSHTIIDRVLPPVEIKQDEWGRDVLIKNLKGGKYDITAGTVEQLVESLAEEAAPDTIYIEVFLLTYRHFTTPLNLITLLKKRFLIQSEDTRANSIIRLRVISVMKKWAERHYYDFRFPEMQEAFAKFMDDVNASDCAKYGGQIKSILDAENDRRATTFTAVAKPIAPPEVAATIATFDFLTASNPKRIAQELTMQDLKLFRTIKPDEFCLFLWGEKNDPRISNFNAYIDRFNRIGFWVTTVIVSQRDMKKRVETVEKFIQILKYSAKYSNYSTTMAILSGLNTTAVSRLKKTWEQVTKGRYIAAYKDVEAKMSYRGNFKAYRELESNAKQPFIPFFGLYVKDLTFMNDGNQKHLVLQTKEKSNPLAKPAGDAAAQQPEAAGEQPPPLAPMINFEKCRGITDKIHALRVFQQSTYKFEEEKEDKEPGFFSSFTSQSGATDAELVVYLGHPYGPPSVDDEKKLIEMSRECEASDRSSIQSPSYTAAPAAAGTSASDVTKPRDPTAAKPQSTEPKPQPNSASTVPA